MNMKYIVSKVTARPSYVSSDSLWIGLLKKGIHSKSHWWDGFLITQCEEEDVKVIKEHLNESKKLTFKGVFNTPDDYHNFTKTYWINLDKERLCQ